MSVLLLSGLPVLLSGWLLTFGCGQCDSSKDEFISGQMAAVSLSLLRGSVFEVP